MKDKISNKEFAWYIVAGIFAAFGIILMVFGILGSNLGLPNFIRDAEKAFMSAMKVNFGFRIWGLFVFLFGAIIGIIALAVNAKKTDREVERQLRRQRTAATNVSNMEVKQAVEVVEAAPAVEPAKAE